MNPPDLAFAFAELSKFVQCPGVKHMQAAKRMLVYLAGTVDEGITWSAPTNAADLGSMVGSTVTMQPTLTSVDPPRDT